MKLQYLDVLVYSSIRSFNNADTSECFPSHETISIKAGLSKRFVISSIKRLEKAKLILVKRSSKVKVSNRYYFKGDGVISLPTFPIPVELFVVSDLSANLKAMLICFRQFFEHGRLKCFFSLRTIAMLLGLSNATVYEQYRELLNKKYITETKVVTKHRKYNKLSLNSMFNVGYEEIQLSLAKPQPYPIIMVA